MTFGLIYLMFLRAVFGPGCPESVKAVVLVRAAGQTSGITLNPLRNLCSPRFHPNQTLCTASQSLLLLHAWKWARTQPRLVSDQAYVCSQLSSRPGLRQPRKPVWEGAAWLQSLATWQGAKCSASAAPVDPRCTIATLALLATD